VFHIHLGLAERAEHAQDQRFGQHREETLRKTQFGEFVVFENRGKGQVKVMG